jgi:signal transduction histidine kinase
VAHEALRNTLKHSGAQEVRVEITGSRDMIRLCVCDNGRGFVMNSANASRGLGMVSMRERLRLVHGTLSITAELSQGVRVEASVPLQVGSEE